MKYLILLLSFNLYAADELTPVTIDWLAPEIVGDPLSGYMIYYGEMSGDYQGSLEIVGSDTLSAQLPVHKEVATYFVMTAKDTAGRESQYSPESVIQPFELIPDPLPPTTIIITLPPGHRLIVEPI